MKKRPPGPPRRALLILGVATGLLGSCEQRTAGPAAAAAIRATACGEVHCPGAGDRQQPPPAVFVFAGQSNMEGLARLDGQAATAIAPGRFAVWVHDHWESYRPSGTFGPELRFLDRYARAHGGTVGVIKYAVGGTSMADWDTAWTPQAARKPRFGPLLLNLLQTHRRAGHPRVLGILWMQGESDAADERDAQQYAVRMNRMLERLLHCMGGAPFAFGMTQRTARKQPHIEQVRATQTELSQRLAPQGVVAVATDDLTVEPDGLHLDAAGQWEFGSRLFEAWESAAGTRPVAQPARSGCA